MVKPRNERNLYFKEGKWYVDFTYRKKRIREFAGYTKEQARTTLAKLRLGKLEEKLGFKRPGSGEPILFADFAKDFLETYCKQNKRSWDRDELSLNNMKPFFKGMAIQNIGPETVERYKAKRKAEVSPATVNRELACLKTMFNKAVEWGKLEANVLRTVRKFKENNSRERILSGPEAQGLIESAPGMLKSILIIALNTGMRRNEILSLKWQNVDFGRGFLFIEDSKSGKSRKVPMNAAAARAFQEVPHESEFVFYNPETKTHMKNIAQGFAKAREAAGISGLRLHDLRHTAASKMVEAGIDLATVSKILGHASIQMTMRYAHPTPENMQRAVDRLGEILGSTRQKDDKSAEQTVNASPVSHSNINS